MYQLTERNSEEATKENHSASDYLTGTAKASHQLPERFVPDWFRPECSSMALGDYFPNPYTSPRTKKDSSDRTYSVNQATIRNDSVITRRYNDTFEALLREAAINKDPQDTQFVPIFRGIESINGTCSMVQENLANSTPLSDMLRNCPTRLDKPRWFTTCLHLVSGLYSFRKKGIAVNSISPETIVVYLGDEKPFPTVWFTDFSRASYIGNPEEVPTMSDPHHPLQAADIEDMGHLLGRICDRAGIEELCPIVDSCVSELPNNRPTALQLLSRVVAVIQPSW